MAMNSLPRWDLTTLFPSLDSAEFRRALDECTANIGELSALMDRFNVRRRVTSTVDAPTAEAFDAVTRALNELLEKLNTVGSYVYCIVTTDAANEEAQSARSVLMNRMAQLEHLRSRYTAWVGTMDAEELLRRSSLAREHEFLIRKAAILAAHQMTEPEESLASALAPCSIMAWAALHGTMTSLLTAEVELDGKPQKLPMSTVRSLATHADRDVRRRAYEAELAAWDSIAVPMAAALNGIKGYQGVLRSRRRYSDDVEPTLVANNIDAATLEAMQQACVESFPDFRRYLRAKAKALHLERMAWYDLSAPVGSDERVWNWDKATEFVRHNFGAYSDRLRMFAEKAFGEGWIDAEPRVGKEGGAYCTSVRPGESRIMMNFDGSFTSVSTLAHELGHGYHNLNLARRTPLQRMMPSTLAETASIFCETLAFEAAMAQASGEERLRLLDTTLQRDLQVVVDIHSRFLFEKAVFQRRFERDLTVSELKELMLDAQRQTYGSDVEPLHPFMWVVKGHYYGPTFYNYPYTFGLLFGLGIYAVYKQDPELFRERYDEFLSSTGMADAATLGAQFGANIRDIGFLRASLDVIRRHIAEFERLVL